MLDYYLEAYDKEVQENIKEDVSDLEEAHTVDGIVGYYLYFYRHEALDMWLFNISHFGTNSTSEQQITLKLKELSDKGELKILEKESVSI